MSAAPKRPFWRFHLATTIILAVETGALIGLNVTPRQEGIRGWPENCIWWRDGQSTPYSYDERRIIIDAGLAFVIVAVTAKCSEYIFRRRESRR